MEPENMERAIKAVMVLNYNSALFHCDDLFKDNYLKELNNA